MVKIIVVATVFTVVIPFFTKSNCSNIDRFQCLNDLRVVFTNGGEINRQIGLIHNGERIMRKLITSTLAVASILVAANVANAGCRGFGCSIVQGIPIIGPAAEAVDQGIAGIKDRGSDADVLHQATGLNSWNNPIGRPAAPTPSSAMPYCVTPYGTFGPDPAALNFPPGTPCWHAFPNGQVVNGQVGWG
jgi:hypothetical protein